MPLPLVAPLVLTAVAAATAGWVGARLWNRGSESEAKLGNAKTGERETGNATANPRPRSKAQTMMWCSVCGTYVVPEKASACTEIGCRFRSS